jgi:hypothetical protein
VVTELRPVLCVVDHAYRDLDVAESACAGRFTSSGVTLDLGLPPDWTGAALPADDEWRIEWTKCYFGLDLAHAFAATGEARFLEAWQQLVGSFIAAVPAHADPSDVTARRVQNWLYAWQRLAAAPHFAGLDPELEERLVRSLREQLLHVRDTLTEGAWRNHRVLELYGLMIGALALPEQLDPDGELLTTAVAGLHDCLLAGTWPDGVHREGSTHYQLLVLRSFVGARENARRFGVELPPGYDERLARTCDFALHCHRPDGPISALGDADSERYGELLALAAALLERPDLEWAATAGASGRPPAQTGASFPHGGYFTQRSGWGAGGTAFADERYLIFDCGPLGEGGHGHYDLLSVEIAAGGRPLLVDPGRFTYAEGTPNLRHWFKGTAAHNTVCVDGLDQTPYRRGRPRGGVAAGRFLGRRTVPGLDVLSGEAHSPSYEVVHTRTVIFVAGEYWLIEDELRGDRPHRYDLRFHLAAGARDATTVDGATVLAPGLALVLDPALDVRIEPGWVSPRYGVRHPAPVINAAVEGMRTARWVSLVYPRSAGDPLPELHAGGIGAAEVRGVGGTDRVCWGEDLSWRRS